MLDLQMITKQQMLDVKKSCEKFNFTSFTSKQQMQAPHFVRYIIDQVLVRRWWGQKPWRTERYSIYTTLELDLEKKVEQIVYEPSLSATARFLCRLLWAIEPDPTTSIMVPRS